LSALFEEMIIRREADRSACPQEAARLIVTTRLEALRKIVDTMTSDDFDSYKPA